MSKSINAFICPLLLKGLRQLQQFHLKKENNGDSCFIVWFHHLVESVSCSDPSLYFYYSCTGECKSVWKHKNHSHKAYSAQELRLQQQLAAR